MIEYNQIEELFMPLNLIISGNSIEIYEEVCKSYEIYLFLSTIFSFMIM